LADSPYTLPPFAYALKGLTKDYGTDCCVSSFQRWRNLKGNVEFVGIWNPLEVAVTSYEVESEWSWKLESKEKEVFRQ
jgi:hypothetical protein